jgi:hypothetical protein
MNKGFSGDMRYCFTRWRAKLRNLSSLSAICQPRHEPKPAMCNKCDKNGVTFT